MVEIWSDGYCVQSGRGHIVGVSGTGTITFVVPYKDNPYSVSATNLNYQIPQAPGVDSLTPNSVDFDYQDATLEGDICWQVSGYIR